MAQAVQTTPIRGSTFIRLLAAVVDAPLQAPEAALPEQLAQWLDWKQALALATALDDKPAALPVDDVKPMDDPAAECARVRERLTQLILTEGARISAMARKADPLDYTPFRQHYQTMQRKMQAATGDLRGRLRDLLATRVGTGAHLASIDAVMEQALSAREIGLLARVPGLLDDHFERLRPAPGDNPDHGWLERFERDLQSLLLAELDLRFQPVTGLLAALRTCQ